MRALLFAAAALPLGATDAHAQQQWQTGQIVLGSGSSIPSGFMRCRVLGGRNDNGYYPLKCLDSYLNSEGKKVVWEHDMWVSEKWIKRNDPSFAPDMQFGNVTPERKAATAAAPQTRDAPGNAIKPGMYQCYGGPAGNMKLRFTATSYANENGSGGSLTRTGPNISFKTGYLAGYAGYIYSNGTIQLRTAPGRPSIMSCQLK